MSAKHPIIAVTGSSGAGTSTSTNAFRSMFHQLDTRRPWSRGTVFTATPGPRWTWRSARPGSRGGISATSARRPTTSVCWSPFPGVWPERHRPVSALSAQLRRGGAFQPDAWHLHPLADPPGETDLLFYEGLHGGVVTGSTTWRGTWTFSSAWCPSSTWVDPEAHSRHLGTRLTSEAVTDSIVRSMDDYINFITPQFSRTHINFQRVPTVDTSNLSAPR